MVKKTFEKKGPEITFRGVFASSDSAPKGKKSYVEKILSVLGAIFQMESPWPFGRFHKGSTASVG